MTTGLTVSITDELVAEIQSEFDRNGPCPHFNWNPLGSGDWIHCDDCGQQVGIEYLEKAKAASEKHGELSLTLRALLAERAELKRDADRYRWLCDKFGITKLPCAVERILSGDVYVADGKAGIDLAIDSAMDLKS